MAYQLRGRRRLRPTSAWLQKFAFHAMRGILQNANYNWRYSCNLHDHLLSSTFITSASNIVSNFLLTANEALADFGPF
jgi:hypothetical protein